jgi:hypothetical protein
MSEWVPDVELIDPLRHLRIYPEEMGEVLLCKCGGPLTATVALLPRGRVELTAIACLKCRTMTAVRKGVLHSEVRTR